MAFYQLFRKHITYILLPDFIHKFQKLINLIDVASLGYDLLQLFLCFQDKLVYMLLVNCKLSFIISIFVDLFAYDEDLFHYQVVL